MTTKWVTGWLCHNPLGGIKFVWLECRLSIRQWGAWEHASHERNWHSARHFLDNYACLDFKVPRPGGQIEVEIEL